jgi:hypothetical protein
MRKNYYLIVLFSIIAFSATVIPSVFAGFGITPPYVKNSSLTRNSVYEQTIFLVRSDPVEDLKVEVFTDVPGINDWFTIDKGNEFLMPRGEVKVPMTVKVLVPDDAEFENYRGGIRIRTSSLQDSASGAVSIALGAQIDVDITIIDKEIFDFRVRKIAISDLNAGHKVGWLYFPGKIQFGVTIENTGNIDVAPTKVEFAIYDGTGKTLLEETENLNKIDKVPPFHTEEVFAELPTKLGAGTYIARYKIYNGEEVKQEGEVSLSIVPYGTLAAAGFGFSGLSLAHKTTIIGPIVLIILLLLFIVRRRKS